jgi:multiple sugar transport system permease protein
LLIFSWNEFLFAFALTSQHARTAPVTVFSFIQVEEVLWGQLHAAGTLVVLPVVLFALVIQRHLVRGLMAGALR